DDVAHKEALLASRRRALRTEGKTLLSQAVPQSEELLNATFQAGEPHARSVRQLETLLRLWGAQPLCEAVAEAMRRGTPTVASVHVLLEQQRRRSRRTVPRPLDLGDRPELEALHVQTHSLEDYDERRNDEDEGGSHSGHRARAHWNACGGKLRGRSDCSGDHRTLERYSPARRGGAHGAGRSWPAQSRAAPAPQSCRTLQADGRLRLELAAQNRSHSTRTGAHARLPSRRAQRRTHGTEWCW